MKLLILCADGPFQELLEAALPHHELDFIAEAPKLKDLDYLNCVFQHDSYDVLVLSNLGMPMPLAMRHVSLLPEVRTYGVLMLSGALSDSDQATCSRRGVEAIRLPVEIRVLCDTLDRLGWPAQDYDPAPPQALRKSRARPARSRKRA
jgi:hypothetical protein